MLGTEDGTLAIVWTVVGQRSQIQDRVQRIVDRICRGKLLRRPREFVSSTEPIACALCR